MATGRWVGGYIVSGSVGKWRMVSRLVSCWWVGLWLVVLIEPKKDAQNVKNELQETLSVLGFSYICSLFIVANDKSILYHGNIKKRRQKMQEKY